VADQLREAILHGELAPGEHLREEDLAARLQVSRGPVRAALALLEREGLAHSAHHRGVVVAELSESDLDEVYTLRSALESLAVRLAITRATEEDLEAISLSLTRFTRALSRRLTERDAARLDLEFHDSIFTAAHNARLSQAWAQIRFATYKFMLSRTTSQDWRELTVSGHTQIVESLASRDETKAMDAIATHIEAAHIRVLAAYTGSPVSEPASTPRARRRASPKARRLPGS
jgi:DNA-binding GntR family transcriptional regulator